MRNIANNLIDALHYYSGGLYRMVWYRVTYQNYLNPMWYNGRYWAGENNHE